MDIREKIARELYEFAGRYGGHKGITWNTTTETIRQTYTEEAEFILAFILDFGYRKVPTEFKVISDERISDRWHYFEMLGDKPKTWHDRLRTLRGICKEQSNDDQKQIAGDYSG